MPQVHRANQAEIDLVEIWLYVAADNMEAADRLLEKIDEKCRLLAERKLLGRERADLDAALRSYSVGNYIIYYKLEPDGIIVSRVLYGSRDQAAELGL